MIGAAKYAPAVAPVAGIGIALHEDALIKIIAVVVGLLFGAMWRAGSLASEGRSWPAIRTDLVVSMMIAGANAVLTLALVEWANFGGLLAMACGVLVGATGLRALPELKEVLLGMARRRLLDEGVSLLQPPNEALTDLTRQLEEKDGNHDQP